MVPLRTRGRLTIQYLIQNALHSGCTTEVSCVSNMGSGRGL